jgi:hypothetical protein
MRHGMLPRPSAPCPSAPGPHPSRGVGGVQARGVRGCPAILLLALCGVAACGGPDPVGIAREAAGLPPDVPAPAEAGSAYPVLGSRPQRPVVTPAEQRRRLTAGLVADRENARWTGPPIAPPPAPQSATPAPPSEPRPSPAAPAAPAVAPAAPAPAEPPPIPVAALPTAPPPPPRLAPAPAIAAEPLPPLPAPQPQAAPPPAPAPPPALPQAPPPAPALAPAVPLPPVPAPAMAPAPAPSPPGPTASIWFAPGSANLPQSEVSGLALLAATSRGARFAVTGFGEAGAPDPAALGRARALAVAAALRQAGVPAGMITTAAEPPEPGAPGARLRVLP